MPAVHCKHAIRRAHGLLPLANLLDSPNNKVVTQAAGAIMECARYNPKNARALFKATRAPTLLVRALREKALDEDGTRRLSGPTNTHTHTHKQSQTQTQSQRRPRIVTLRAGELAKDLAHNVCGAIFEIAKSKKRRWAALLDEVPEPLPPPRAVWQSLTPR
jgi:hypothetical protein